MKRTDVRPTRLVDSEGIARHHNVNIMLYEPNEDREKDAGSMWWLAYGKIQHKNDLPTISMGLWEAIVFTSSRRMCFVGNGTVKGVTRYLRETRI